MTTKKSLLLLVFSLNILIGAQAPSRLFRFPAIHEQQIVFSYAGNLYTVKDSGGVARKLTNHRGYEMFARFSPDGKHLAFTAQYDGNTEVYLMLATGGIPKRLTYTATISRDHVADRMGPNNIVMNWKRDGSHIVFRSRMHSFNSFNGALFAVSPHGGLPRQLPLPRGGFCCYAPDDSKLAYNRIFREFRTWKRYRGGMADDIWIYDFADKNVVNITSHPAQDIIPMWHKDSIYFLSDRDQNKRMNLFVYRIKDKAIEQLTHFSDFDVKFPSIGVRAIVFENGGYIYRYDLATEKCERVPIVIREDLHTGRNGLVRVDKYITDYTLAPDGSRVLVAARGEIYSIPAVHGNVRKLSDSPGVQERNCAWSPDGKWIAYIGDASGEDEIYYMRARPQAKPIQLTFGADTYKYQPVWSPDSKKLMWSDKKLRLRYLDVESKKITTVATATNWEIRDYSWAPDSKWIAYAKPQQRIPVIYVYSLATATSYAVTQGWYYSYQPIFSANGKYLFLVSSRTFKPLYSQTERNHAYRDMAKIYLVLLAANEQSPLAAQSDELDMGSTQASKTGDDKADASKIEVTIHPKGLAQRIVELPIAPASYYNLTSIGTKLYYQRNSSKDEKPQLFVYDLDKRIESNLGTVDNYVVSCNGKKMLLVSDKKYSIIDTPTSAIKIENYLKLKELEIQLDRHREWQQIFRACWRQIRDFFYAPNMHGVDWQQMYDRYQPLVEHVNHRADLTYIIGEMIGELNAGHAYVGGGDMPKPRKIPLGLLGAQLERDAVSGYYRLQKILKGQNWHSHMRSPLTEIGVNAAEGDYILAINGKSVAQVDNIYRLLVNTAGKQVTLQINSRPQQEGSREVVVIPIADESPLYYYNWVQNNLQKVTEASKGQIGYIHIPDMGVHGLNQFAKYFYPQLNKKALIIDVRGNGGGNVSPMIIERLRRKLAMVSMARNTLPHPNPGDMHHGPKICLMDEFSASDGDLFPYRFKKHNLGKTIGKRSWGGVVGIRNSLPLSDNGYLYKPEFAPYDEHGQNWIIEGRGVDPDIVVDNDPAQEYAGNDNQLTTAIRILLQQLQQQHLDLPAIPKYPEK